MNPLLCHAPDLSHSVAAYFLDRASSHLPGTGISDRMTSPTASALTGAPAAFVLIAFLALTVAVILGCFIALRPRRAVSRPEHDLIEEVLRNEDQLAAGSPAGGDPWEKRADWWKKS